MSQQTINTGTAPNTFTGDPLRTAFTKCNSNFNELYSFVGASGTAGGDLSGSYPNPTVAKIGGKPISLGATFSTSASFATGGTFSTADGFSTGASFATTGPFSTGGTFSTTGSFTSGGTFSTAGPFSTTGSFALAFQLTGPTSVIVPTAGTLALQPSTGTFTLNANSTSTTLSISSLTPSSLFQWFPLTANASNIVPFLYTPSSGFGTGTVTLNHPSNPNSDLTFAYLATIPAASTTPAPPFASGAFTLATNSTSTTVSISGLLATSIVTYSPKPGANAFYAAAMLPNLYPSSQSLGSVTFIHPVTTNTCIFNYIAEL